LIFISLFPIEPSGRFSVAIDSTSRQHVGNLCLPITDACVIIYSRKYWACCLTGQLLSE